MLFCLVIFGSNNEVLIGKLCLSSGSICLSLGMCQSMILFCLSPNLAIYSSCLYRMRDLLQYLMVGVAPGISFVQRDRIINIITLQNITHIRNQINFCNMIKNGLNLFFNYRLPKRKMIYNFQNQKLQMEDILQTVSNDHRSIYYAVQLKLMDVSQNIKLMGTSFKENDLKIAVADMLNHSYMLESIFEQAKIPHIYQLIKNIAVNFNSAIAILLQKLDKATKKEISLLQLQHEEQNQTKKSDEGVISNGSLIKEIKKNRLGGIHLFNENYSRYIEDQMILDQIKSEKMKRLQMKRMEILRESVLQDINNLTDVQEFPAKSDDIANYIIQAKDKNSMFNYVSYQPQLQEILEFFQKSQNEANQFLMRKMRDVGEQQGHFSFADFQRDIQLKNLQFRKKVMDKMNDYTDKYRTKQRQLQEYIKQKQNQFRQMQNRKIKCDKQVQTQIIFEEQLSKFDKTIKELTEKCHSYQSMTKEHINNERQKEISRKLVQRQADIEKQNKKMAQLQLTIQSLKQLLKDQKIKRINSSKSIDFRSQRTIPQPAPLVEKQRKLYIPKKQKDQQNTALIHNIPSQKFTQNTKKAESVTNTDRLKRQNSDTASFLSFHDVDKDKFGRQTLKAQKKITVKLTNKSEQNKQQTSLHESKEASEHPKVSFKEIDSKNQMNKVDFIAKTQKIEQIKGEHSKQQLANNSKQINSSSSKNIEGQLIKKQLKMINDNMNLTVKSKGTPNSLKKIKFQHKQSLNNTSKKEIKERINEVQNKSKVEQKLKMQVQADVEVKISSKRQKILQDNTKKQKSQYQMYQVTEEEHEQQTAKPSFANSKQPSIKSLPSNQKTLIQKLNQQLKKIKDKKTLQLKKLYSLTINPSPQIVVKSNKKQSSLTQESDIIIHNDNKSYKKVMKLFENLIQNGSKSQVNAQKVRKWKRTMLSNLKSNIISQDQIDQITAVIRGASFTKGHASVYENSVTSVASISHHIRNSLPQIQQITNLSPKVKIRNTKKSKNLLTVPENQQAKNKQNQRLVTLSQYQEQMQDLIKNQSLQTNFPQKFHRLHKNCEQGTLCTHVAKYFEAIMRHYEQLKKKQRPSYALPVQRIGNRSRIQQQAITKQMKQSQQNKSLRFQKSSQKLKHNRNSSLLKNHYSQQIILPNINDYKMKNVSHSVFKQQMI